ncbi:hypothetical protein PAXRUDRAFT_178111, partial [Paxillus rubicundulus Ve08.2h10]
AAAYATVYNDHLISLHAFDKHTVAYDLLGQIQQTLHDNARCYSGAQALNQVSFSECAIDSVAFDEAIREYELEQQADMEEGHDAGDGNLEGTQARSEVPDNEHDDSVV